jgi:glycosyltransferase involved in cell wall biosynthesis
MSAPAFQHEVEDKLPRAEHGRLVIKGWCLAGRQSNPPSVRLVVGETAPLSPARRAARRDVIESLGAAATAEQCGFVFETKLSPGAHPARLEASADGKAWQLLRRFLVLATPDRLQVGIEGPDPAKPIDRSVRVMGWCAHPHYPLREISLHYGTQRVRCTTGLPREDVPRFLPESPDAARAGFISIKNLPVGRGPLRVRAVAASGEILVADTGAFVDITQDEDHPKPFVLPRHRPELGPARRTPTDAPPAPDAAPLRILFALYGDFTSNSAIHVTNLANQLAARGHACTVAVPGNVETAAYFRQNRFEAVDFDELSARAALPAFDVIHAWTTRENVRLFCAQLLARMPSARLVVHLEDNELRILELSVGQSLADLLALPAAKLDALIPPTLSHPRHSREMLARADGVTVILDSLRAQVPADKPLRTIWPAADATGYFPRPRPVEFRRALGWADDRIVLFYHGNAHPSNRAEMHELYAAVLELNQRGHPCTLIRLGRDACDFLGDLQPRVAPHVMNLGVLANHLIPVLMSLADYFVQPGEPDAFNDFRFPSKLPEFFAIGRPVILPRTNIGLLARHGEDGYVVDRADRHGIVQAILELQADPRLRERLSAGATAFARQHFSWAHSAGLLLDFYRSLAVPRPAG